MSEERPDNQEAQQQGGVFGKLPDSRPGSRSPRRDGANRQAAAKPRSSHKPPTAAKRPKPSPAREPRPRQAPASPPPAAATDSPPESGAGLDDLAWAGVAAIAEAATFGVRLANRAFGAIRGGDDSDVPR
jgi:hypothetical protein